MPRPGPRTTNKYSESFKATAVALSHLPGVAGARDQVLAGQAGEEFFTFWPVLGKHGGVDQAWCHHIEASRCDFRRHRPGKSFHRIADGGDGRHAWLAFSRGITADQDNGTIFCHVRGAKPDGIDITP